MGKTFKAVRAPLTLAEQQAHQKAQARERARRGFVTFTRPELRERVLGRTEGENVLQRNVRGDQASRRRAGR